MRHFARLLLLAGILYSFSDSRGQELPNLLSFTTKGGFENAVAQSSQSLLITDNNLTGGYHSGLDLTDAPSSLVPYGPAGSAMFQWGSAADWTSYPHPSALWFEPLAVVNATVENSFSLGYLYYRNGTIQTDTGATSVDLSLTLEFSDPSGIDPLNAVYTSNLINTPNTDDPIASADIVSLGNTFAPVSFTDSSGTQYYLELTFRVDQDTLDGTLSTPTEFRVFEGGQGRAELLGRFTTVPAALPVPEPGSALLSALALPISFRRRRR